MIGTPDGSGSGNCRGFTVGQAELLVKPSIKRRFTKRSSNSGGGTSKHSPKPPDYLGQAVRQKYFLILAFCLLLQIWLLVFALYYFVLFGGKKYQKPPPAYFNDPLTIASAEFYKATMLLSKPVPDRIIDLY
jgi:hypothetical protein